MKVIAQGMFALLLLAGNASAQTTPAPSSSPGMQPSNGRVTNEEPRSMGPAKSARFRLQVGHVFLGLTCPDDESLKACGDFAVQLLDKAQSMQKP